MPLLQSVTRLQQADKILIINGKDGAWLAELVPATKRSIQLLCQRRTRDQTQDADLWLIFSPLKKARADLVVEKATELGVAWIIPCMTDFTNSERVRQKTAIGRFGQFPPHLRTLRKCPSVATKRRYLARERAAGRCGGSVIAYDCTDGICSTRSSAGGVALS